MTNAIAIRNATIARLNAPDAIANTDARTRTRLLRHVQKPSAIEAAGIARATAASTGKRGARDPAPDNNTHPNKEMPARLPAMSATKLRHASPITQPRASVGPGADVRVATGFIAPHYPD
jgi:hypothetical protein